jgi:hypothetical protein
MLESFRHTIVDLAWGFIVKNIITAVCVLFMLGACATSPKVTRVQTLPESADAPYDNILVVSLFESFDARRLLEREIVRQLQAEGIEAVASTSMMNTKTPVNRDTFLAMVEEKGSDAVLVTQLVSLDIQSKMKNRSPRATYNIRPTYYFNVYDVELTEYTEPQGLEMKQTLTLATQVFSVSTKEPVWAIETNGDFKRNVDMQRSGDTLDGETRAIINAMKRDGLL